jgi:hypothetical protein
MSVAQLSLWDTESVENGYRCMFDLQLDKALEYFNESIHGLFANELTTIDAIDACNYWRVRINKTDKIFTENIRDFLKDYQQYPFTRLLTGLKKTLLTRLADFMCMQQSPDWEDIEKSFDLLLGVKEYQKAVDFILAYINQNKEKCHLLYFLAQAQWMNKDKAEANDHYILALLHQPDKLFLDRIENQKLVSVINNYGAALAPAYALALHMVPFVPVVKEVKFIDNDHAAAMESLNLLREVNKAFVHKDDKLLLKYRKKLKTQNPSLFQVYFNQLKAEV